MNVKQYIATLKAFYRTHAQINTVKSGNQFDFNCMSKIKYPIAHIEYVRRQTQSGNKVYSFLITIADIFDPNLEGSDEDIYSDTEEIANDTLNHFANVDSDDWQVPENIQVEKFNNGLKDKVCGSVFTLQFSEFNTLNDCNIPTK